MLHRDQILPFLQDFAYALGLDFKLLPPEELWYCFLACFLIPYEYANISNHSMASQPLIICRPRAFFKLEELLELSYGANEATAVSVLFLLFQ